MTPTTLKQLRAENERIMAATAAMGRSRRSTNPGARRPTSGSLTNKEVLALANELIGSGQLEYLGRSGGGHHRFRCPDGEVITQANSGVSQWALRHFRRELKRHGVILP